MRITKASAAEIAQTLSPRAKQLLAAMFVKKSKFSFKGMKEYGALTTELVCAHIIRVDWDIMHHEVLFILEHTGRYVVDYLRKASVAAKTHAERITKEAKHSGVFDDGIRHTEKKLMLDE